MDLDTWAMQNKALRSTAHRLGRLVMPFMFILAFVLPPAAVVLGVAQYGGMLTQKELQVPAFDARLPQRPPHDAAKKTALVVAGNTATESSDLLGPYEVLATSGEYNVYVVTPERKLTPLIPIPQQLCCGTLDLMPHYSFAEYEQTFGATPDLVVVPYIPYASTQDVAVLEWLRHLPEQTTILSICGGAQMVADAGLLGGHSAASHHTIYPIVQQSHPEVNWTHGLRYVDDGRFISSAGVTSGVDAALHTLDRFFGRDVALRTAEQMGYPHTEFLDDPTWHFTEVRSLFPAIMPNAFRGERTQIGLLLYNGIREVALSSITDTYPRSTAADVIGIGLTDGILRTAHGLDLLPRLNLSTATELDRLLVPGTLDRVAADEVDRWAAGRGLTAEHIHAAGGYPYDLTLRDLARHETRPIAVWAAAWLEYPIADLGLQGREWQLELILRAFGIGVLGVLIVAVTPRVVRWLSTAPARIRPSAGQTAVRRAV
jgi:AraC family transcriptional activator FtrA